MTKLPTRWRLACALIAAELYDMAERAAAGYYDDFDSPLDMPITTLVADLRQVGTPAALLIAEDAMQGEFDASDAEAEAWGRSPEAQEAFANVLRRRRGG